MSQSWSGAQANSISQYPTVSSDGRFIAFYSSASNLVANDTNGVDDTFVYDRQTGAIERVSVASNGTEANGSSRHASLSADGRFVAFYSAASNLVGSDTNGVDDVFVRDRWLGTTARVSLATNGSQATSSSRFASISGDGRFVAFESSASNLIAGDTNGKLDVFVYDRQTATTARVSMLISGTQGIDDSYSPRISADGRFVAFFSYAPNLVANDQNNVGDIFVHDRATGALERINVSTAGVEANAISGGTAISANGRFVAFDSYASNLVTGDSNGRRDVFVRDRQSGQTERVSISTVGSQATGETIGSGISLDGRFVTFWSFAGDLVFGDSNNMHDVFVHDRQTGATELVSVGVAGALGNSTSQCPAISGDGRIVTFHSFASNLVAGDTNAAADVFVRDRGAQGAVSYCTAGTTTSNCLASISASGIPSASAPSGFVLSVAAVEGQKEGLIFYGIAGRDALPWGASSSSLCIHSPTQRMSMQSSSGTAGACDGSFAQDWLAWLISHPSSLGAPANVGSVVDAQAWFRDPASPKTTSLSNALEFTVTP